MNRWLRQLLLILGILLCVSSARGIAADLGQLGASLEPTSEEADSAPEWDPGSALALSGGSTTKQPVRRSISISPAFLASANGEPVTLLSIASLPSAHAASPAGLPQSNANAPNAAFRDVAQAPQMETEQPARIPGDPTRIVIPAIHLDAPVVLSVAKAVNVDGKQFQQWAAPDKFAGGWQEGSARLGELGNTVLNGHHNVHGEVFRNLVDLEQGDMIQVYAGDRIFTYMVTNRMILPEAHQEIDIRMDNARWILPSTDERLTLITCWPYQSNTHRLIIVALPVP